MSTLQSTARKPAARAPRDLSATISFVVPMHNEEDCVQALYERLTATAAGTGLPFEIVCIDDGSDDRTVEALHALHRRDPRVKIVSLSRNFGHQVAVMAGLRYAHGSCVVILDADLQDPPEVLVRMLELWRDGFQVVYGIRRRRNEGLVKNFSYRLFYRLINRFSQIHIPLDAGDFCLMDRRVAQELAQFGEQAPFVRGLRCWVGFRQTGIEYDRPARAAGKSKYSYWSLMRLAWDGLASFSDVFLKISTVIGLAVSTLSILYALVIGANRIFIAMGWLPRETLIPGWATLVCSVMFLLGLQFVFLGILGEYVGRTFTQAKGRPLFIVDRTIGIEPPDPRE